MSIAKTIRKVHLVGVSLGHNGLNAVWRSCGQIISTVMAWKPDPMEANNGSCL